MLQFVVLNIKKTNYTCFKRYYTEGIEQKIGFLQQKIISSIKDEIRKLFKCSLFFI